MKKLAILLGLIIVLVLSATVVQAAPPPGGQTGLERAIAAQEAHNPQLLRTQGVVGTAVGMDANGNYDVRIFTERAGVPGLPASLDGVPVAVKVTGKISALKKPATAAAFTYTINGLEVNFDASASSGTRLSYQWNFGDNSSGSGVRTSHAYTAAGTYDVILTVTDKFGSTGTASQTVNVQPSSGNVSPVAYFTYTVNNLECHFDGTGSHDSDGSIDSWDWTFGDGASGTGATTSHTYTAAGTHSVTLTVTDNEGATDDYTQSVTVAEAVYPPLYYDRPVPIGVSTGNVNSISAGTIACRVKDGSGNLYALSNTHVYAPDNIDNAGALGNTVSQPGVYDIPGYTYTDNYLLGQLTNYAIIDGSILGLLFPINTIDAAIARTDASLLGKATPPEGYGTPKSNTVFRAIGMQVQKFGRTTGLTQGTITGVNATITVGYSDNWYAGFFYQIVVESNDAFILPGDSGSLLVTEDDNSPVGLLFAGDSTGTMAFANEIDRVLNAFGVTIDGE